MADPKTVREWLETLPDPLRQKAISEYRGLNGQTISLGSAVYQMAMSMSTANRACWWVGVSCYIGSQNQEANQHPDYYQGYTAAKSAFEAQQNPSPIYTTRDTHSVVFTPVGYICIDPTEHAELTRKAAAYDAARAVIERLLPEIDDLKTLFL